MSTSTPSATMMSSTTTVGPRAPEDHEVVIHGAGPLARIGFCLMV
jgi:hypothetical protein